MDGIAIAICGGLAYAAWSVGAAEAFLFALRRWHPRVAVRTALLIGLWLLALMLPLASLRWFFDLFDLRAHETLGGDARGVVALIYAIALFVYLFPLLSRLSKLNREER